MDIAALIVAVASAFGVIFLAELGDKTQLLALGFGAKYPLRTVAIGLAIGFGVSGAIAAVVGGVIGAALPQQPIAIAGGVIFLAFAIYTLVGNGDDDDDDAASAGSLFAKSAVLSIAVSIALGEFGDKTQLATATLAAQSNPFAVWLGATAGEVTAAMFGAVIGRQAGTRLNPAIIRYASAALFAIFGVILLLGAL